MQRQIDRWRVEERLRQRSIERRRIVEAVAMWAVAMLMLGLFLLTMAWISRGAAVFG